MKKIISMILNNQTLKNKSHLLIFLGLFLLGAIGMTIDYLKKPELNENKKNTSEDGPDTVIPKGYVLVPIELSNAESISSIISEFAIVDLYATANGKSQQGKRVAQHLRLLRAPLNPRAFAVLVPDAEAQSIVGTGNPLVAVVQNRNQKGMGYLEKKNKLTSHVEYYSGQK